MEYYQELSLEGKAFAAMREDTNIIIQQLFKKMMEKESQSGSISIKIDIELMPDYVSAGEKLRMILKPSINHKVSSIVQVKGELKGGATLNGLELAFDEEAGEYILKKVQTDQMTIYDGEGEAEE